MQEKQSRKFVIIEILILVAILLSGVLGTFLLCLINHAEFGIRLWPMILCIDVFVFSTAGFFLTGHKHELIYGICSIASAACMIVQMAIVF